MRPSPTRHRRALGKAAPAVAALTLGALVTAAVAADAVSEAREQAVLLAREGAYAEAAEALRALLARHPGALGVRADLVAVLEWAGRYEAAAAVAEGLQPSALEDHALLAWARALRGLGEHEQAYALLEPRLDDSQTGADVGVLAALLLTDLERDGAAAERIATTRRAHPSSAEAAAAAAYIKRRLARPVDALNAALEALRLAPDHREGWRQKVFALADLGASERALELALEREAYFSPEERIGLNNDRAARRVYWARAHRDFPDRGLEEAAHATALLEALLDDPAVTGAARLRARYDYVTALREQGRMAEATAAYEALAAEGHRPPAYVLEAAADAYLHERRPREAVPLYHEVLREDPWHFNARMALFYALIESERFADALGLIDALAEEKPAWLAIDGTDQRTPYWRKLNVDLAAAMARAFANQHGEAQQRLETLADDAPASAQIRRELSTLYRWRGWPHRALAEIEVAQQYEPEIVAGRLAHNEALMALERFPEARAGIAALVAEHPEDPRVRRQLERWNDRRRWRADVESIHGASDGFRELGSRDRQLRVRLTAPPIASHWQAYLFNQYTDGRFPEGTADHDRAGIGLTWRQRRRRAHLELHGNRRGDTEAGVTAGYDWHVGDHWSFAVRGESFSTDIPLRARGHGLEAWKVEGGVRWQAHESLGLYGGMSRLDISDGNVRAGAWAGSEHRLRADPRHVTTGAVDAYASRAHRDGGPYFNPRRETSLGYTVTHDWITWRHYERAFTQRFAFGAAAYRQGGFGTDAVGLLRYEHRWQVGHNLDLRYGGGLSSRPYDGERERRLDFHLSLQGRL